MPLKAPRLHLRTLLALVALNAVLLWAGAWVWSPLNRLSARLGPETPAYLRREAAIGLGYGIPPWETERAVSTLIRTLGDPSPRVRESAAAGLTGHGANARGAIPYLLKLVNDKDRGARASALGALGVIEAASGGKPNPEVIAALIRALDDSAMEVRLMAAEALVGLGEFRVIVPVLIAALAEPEGTVHLCRAKLLMGRIGGKTQVLMPVFAKFITDPDPGRRDAALKILVDHGGPEVVKYALRRGLQNQDASVRQWAASTMDRLGLAASP
ncbi:HEAT repeat domain-containing protein [Singulisphaera sp. Ch08]|uniref:HEAT repeat domain-containing protein n=1 Tax=Singulisphaera sp. Ch08 TaxID=3120278 RepID=A0AAU7CJ93_9BACT